MKILHICNDYRSNSLYTTMFTKLNEIGLDEIVYVPFKKQLNITEPKEYKVVHSKCYTDLDRFFFFKKSKKIYNDLQININKGLDTVELVHAHTLFSNGILAYKLKKERKIDYVVSVRHTDIDVFFKKMVWLRGTGIKILLNAKKIIFVSESIKNNLLSFVKDERVLKKINEQSIVLTNGINDFWLENTSKKGKITNPYNILQVGWINPNKNQINSFKAIELLNEQGVNCNLTIVGGVEYKKHERYYQKLISYIANSKYKNKVNFIERQNKENLINIYREADIFLMPSLKETFGLVYIEAMSQGLPIIYTKNQGVDGLFNQSPVGEKVDPLDQKNIADGIVRTIENYSVYNNNIGIQLDRYSWDNIVQDILEVYKA